MHAKPLISATVLLPLLAFGGCPSASDPAAPPTDASVASQECAPMVELEQLDPRTPLPLSPMMAWHQKQNMMEHLVAIQRITDGLARGDWDEIASASARIGASPEMDQTCSHMGAGAEGFTALALDFHRRADAIGVAARAQDSVEVLRATAHTLQACTTCHATYRQDIVAMPMH